MTVPDPCPVCAGKRRRVTVRDQPDLFCQRHREPVEALQRVAEWNEYIWSRERDRREQEAERERAKEREASRRREAPDPGLV